MADVLGPEVRFDEQAEEAVDADILPTISFFYFLDQNATGRISELKQHYVFRAVGAAGPKFTSSSVIYIARYRYVQTIDNTE